MRCPKCDNYITFDETQYENGQSLVFQCPECGKQFGIRIGVSKLRQTQKEENAAPLAPDDDAECGSLLVIENVFHYKQVLPLKPGDNITTLFLTEKGEFVSGESFVLEKAPLLEDKPLPDGRYAFNFRFDTPHNEVVDSEGALFAIEGGQLVAASNQ